MEDRDSSFILIEFPKVDQDERTAQECVARRAKIFFRLANARTQVVERCGGGMLLFSTAAGSDEGSNVAVYFIPLPHLEANAAAAASTST